MPDALAAALTAALAHPGLVWIAIAAFVAGAVRGFAGFGTALVFMPVAGAFLPPVWALVVLVVMDAFGPLPTLRRTLPDAVRGDVARLWLGMVLALPLGLWLLQGLDPWVFRLLISLAGIGVTAVLIAGLRYHGPMSPPLILGTGALSGFLGGLTGVPGPPVILLYMASPHPPALIRATTMIYLLLFDLTLLGMLGVMGELAAEPVLLGLVMAVPTMLGTTLGAALFRPAQARLYRLAGYGIVLASAILGLPFWS